MRALGRPCRVTTTGALRSSTPLKISVARFLSSLMPIDIVATVVASQEPRINHERESSTPGVEGGGALCRRSWNRGIGETVGVDRAAVLAGEHEAAVPPGGPTGETLKLPLPLRLESGNSRGVEVDDPAARLVFGSEKAYRTALRRVK